MRCFHLLHAIPKRTDLSRWMETVPRQNRTSHTGRVMVAKLPCVHAGAPTDLLLRFVQRQFTKGHLSHVTHVVVLDSECTVRVNGPLEYLTSAVSEGALVAAHEWSSSESGAVAASPAEDWNWHGSCNVAERDWFFPLPATPSPLETQSRTAGSEHESSCRYMIRSNRQPR